jgi:hypothetical protein
MVSLPPSVAAITTEEGPLTVLPINIATSNHAANFLRFFLLFDLRADPCTPAIRFVYIFPIISLLPWQTPPHKKLKQ